MGSYTTPRSDELILATLRLFKALPVDDHTPGTVTISSMRSATQNGILFTPDIVRTYPNLGHAATLASNLYGKNTTQLNASFHRSFAKVRDASMRQLVLEQILHYWTTYGAERMGVYSEDNVYIPGEAFNAPELSDGVTLVVVRGLTHDELRSELFTLVGSGIALKDQTLTDALAVARVCSVTSADLPRIANKEFRVQLCDELHIVPTDPVEFLRYVVYQATGKSGLVKSAGIITQVREADKTAIQASFDTFRKQASGFSALSTVFYRYKPIFLALRTTKQLRVIVNQIRRLARTNHVPMPEDFLNTITARIGRDEQIHTGELIAALSKANIFRKIRLAYALQYRLNKPTSILYRVRNGKSYATAYTGTVTSQLSTVFELVRQSIVLDLVPKLAGKKVYLPKNVHYALPATEKMFTGNLPTGTYVELDADMVCGVHWFDQGHRVDLDLSMNSITSGKIGWDGSYRNHDAGVYFSGDVTSAPKPHGAAEWFRLSPNRPETWLMMLNYYNAYSSQEDTPTVPTKIVVGRASTFDARHVIDPNNVVLVTNTEVSDGQKTLGIVDVTPTTTRFYFVDTEIGGKKRSFSASDHAQHAQDYMLTMYRNTISLNEILHAAGVVLVDSVPDADINLSSENVDKNSFIRLLSGL